MEATAAWHGTRWRGMDGNCNTAVLRAIGWRALMVANYLGLRTGIMLPLVSREPSRWDVWIMNAGLVLTGGVEFALGGLLLRFAISAILSSIEHGPTYWQGLN